MADHNRKSDLTSLHIADHNRKSYLTSLHIADHNRNCDLTSLHIADHNRNSDLARKYGQNGLSRVISQVVKTELMKGAWQGSNKRIHFHWRDKTEERAHISRTVGGRLKGVAHKCRFSLCLLEKFFFFPP